MNSNNFTKRTVLIFTLFIIVLIFGSIFIYSFRNYTDVAVKEYVEKLTTCEDILSAQGCFAVESCVGIYGPSCPDCEDSEFKYCQKIPSHVQKSIIKDKQKCEETSGQWYRNKLGSFCSCDQVGESRKFDKNLGCIDR